MQQFANDEASMASQKLGIEWRAPTVTFSGPHTFHLQLTDFQFIALQPF